MTSRHPLDDLDADIRDHLDRQIEENIARGMTPDEAHDAARRAFGNIALAKENARAVWVPIWIDQLVQDARYALRLFRRAPGFVFVVVVTLALGIGLTTAVFSVVNAVLMRPLAYAHAERLVSIVTFDERVPIRSIEAVSAPDFLAFREHATTLDRVVAFFIAMERIASRDEVVAARVATVSHEFWDLAATAPALGRLPAPGEEAVLLSHAFFERAFGGDPAFVGRPAIVNDRPVLVAGVLPRGFRPQLPPPVAVSQLQAGDIEAYHTTIVRPPAPTDLAIRLFYVMGRMQPHATIAQVTGELEALRADVRRANPRRPSAPQLRVVPFAQKLVGEARRPLLVLLGAVLLVLAIACANIANLLLARGSARQKEVAIRAAIGAGRGRVLRQFLVEALVLTVAGGAGGLLVARGALAVMLRLVPYAMPRLVETTIDGRVLAFALAASSGTAIVCGVAAAAALFRMDVYGALKEGGRRAAASAGALRIRRALVAGEFALAVVLLVGAALLGRSFWRITAYPPGFVPDRVLTLKVQLGVAFGAVERRRLYLDEVLRRARSVPGVQAAGVSSNADSRIRLVRQDGPPIPILERPIVQTNVTSAGYAATIGMRMVRGRWMTDEEPSPVFVINETLARRYFPGEDPIGKRLLLPNGPDPARAAPVPIVGIVEDLRDANLETPTEPELFTDYTHASPFAVTIAIRTSGDPAAVAPAIRASLAGIDRRQALFEVKSLAAALAESIAPRRFNLMLLATFGGSALLLALVGVYGVIAYSVAQRTHEIGVRMALGAERRQVVRMVIAQGMRIAAAGIAIGVVAALALTRVMTTLLYEVTPTDPPTFTGVVALLGIAALAACAAPAIRAALVDPIEALRCE